MRFFVFLLLFYFLCEIGSVQAGFPAQPAPSGDIDRLRANVLALDRVQNNIHQDINLRTLTATISPEETNELLIFGRYLQDRNREYCAQLEQLAGHGAAADLPCPEKRVALPEARAKTMAEEVTELDQILAESLGAFDEMLLKEQEMITSRQPRQRESGAGRGRASGSTGGGGEGEDGKGDQSESTASGQQASGGQEHRQTTAGAASAGRPGQADGQAGNINRTGRSTLNSDDDIVARQLREAAEKETDPELKEKLWDEYRKYKTGS